MALYTRVWLLGVAFSLVISGCISIPEFKSNDAGSSDGGTTDAPSAIAANVIFVTSETRPPASFGGDLTQADAWCQQLADASNPKLPANRYVAWLSKTGDSVDARIRATGARGWVRPDGKPVATSIDALLVGNHWYPPRLDENGRDLYDTDPLVVTGTTAQGNPFNTCGDWADAGQLVQRGAPDSSAYLWTEFASGSCVSSRIYCVGVEKNASVSLEMPAAGSVRLAFVSAATVTPSAGRAAFDAQCTTEAGNATLQGQFVAAVAEGSSSIASRFTLDKPWARVDGVIVLSANMTKMDAPIALDANGNQRNSDVIGGAPSFVAAPTSTCTNWSVSSGMMTSGESMRSFPEVALSDTLESCGDTTHRVYCLQM